MSFRVLLIPEDQTQNGYILKPLVGRMLAELGKPNANVHMPTDPRFTGYDHACRAIVEQLPARYGHFDLWLFLPDADRGTDVELGALENKIRGQGINLFCCAADPEVEAWALAGHRDKIPGSWAELKLNPRFKEEVFTPFLAEHGDLRAAGGGRERLMRETLANYRGLLAVCPELTKLEQRVQEFIG